MKNQTVDFLILYEVKNRELDNIVLLKYELERRGYTVRLLETWRREYHYQPPVDARVVVSFAMYNDGLFDYVGGFVRRMERIVNLQWEQQFSNAEETNPTTSIAICGKAKQAVHIAWGPNTIRRLVDNYGVAEDHVALTGHIALDFLRPAFSGYYEDRASVCARFGLPEEKKLYLFLSSFSFIDMPDASMELEMYANLPFDPRAFKDISLRSQQALFDWFDRVLPLHPEVAFIYRLHPAEVGNDTIEAMRRKHPNFYVIRDLSVKQWILIADKIYNWYSTSMGEIFGAKRGCTVLRPLKIPYEIEMPVFNKCEFLTDFDTFAATFSDCSEHFPVPEEEMRRFYTIDPETPTYLKICDVLERVMRDDSLMVDRALVAETKPLSGAALLRRRCREAFNGAAAAVFGTPKMSALLGEGGGRLRTACQNAVFARKMTENNDASAAEIAAVQGRIASVLARNQR